MLFDAILAVFLLRQPFSFYANSALTTPHKNTWTQNGLLKKRQFFESLGLGSLNAKFEGSTICDRERQEEKPWSQNVACELH